MQWSKCTNRTSTSLQPTLCCSTILHRLQGIVKTCITIRYGSSTAFAVFETGFLNLYMQCFNRQRSSQNWTAETRSQNWFYNLYRPSTKIAVLKTGLPNLWMQGLNRFCSCQTLLTTVPQTFNRVYCRQNCLAQLLRAFKRLGGGQNMYHHQLQAFNRLCSSQNWFAEYLQAFN